MGVYEYAIIEFIALSVMGVMFMLPGLIKDAFAPQPGLPPDRVEMFLMNLPGRLKRIKNFGPRLITHHGVKVRHAWLRWQGYKPLVLNTRTVWVPTHTILTPHQTF